METADSSSFVEWRFDFWEYFSFMQFSTNRFFLPDFRLDSKCFPFWPTSSKWTGQLLFKPMYNRRVYLYIQQKDTKNFTMCIHFHSCCIY